MYKPWCAYCSHSFSGVLSSGHDGEAGSGHDLGTDADQDGETCTGHDLGTDAEHDVETCTGHDLGTDAEHWCTNAWSHLGVKGQMLASRTYVSYSAILVHFYIDLMRKFNLYPSLLSSHSSNMFDCSYQMMMQLH